jgi:hypothetical protein
VYWLAFVLRCSLKGGNQMKINFRVSVQLFVFFAVLVFSLLLFFAPPVFAKGNFSKIVVSGGSLTSDLVVTDPALMGFFSFSNFPDARTGKPQDINIDDGYIVSRGGEENGVFEVWDRLAYYPNTDGAGGYIYYEGLVNGSSEYDGKWYIASIAGDVAMRRLLGIPVVLPQWPGLQLKNGSYPL